MEEILKKLILILKKGDQSAFEEFYQLTKEKIFYNIFALTKNYSLSEDLLQDTYITFLKMIPNIDEEKSIIGLLMTISRNLTLDFFRKNKKIVELDDIHEKTIKAEEKNNIDKHFLIDNIRKILNDKEMEILILHIFSDMTFESIAKMKKKALGTILWSYNNSIKKLKRSLNYENY